MATPTTNAQTLTARRMINEAVIRDFRLLFNAQSWLTLLSFYRSFGAVRYRFSVKIALASVSLCANPAAQ
jgi:hypothetical protein